MGNCTETMMITWHFKCSAVMRYVFPFFIIGCYTSSALKCFQLRFPSARKILRLNAVRVGNKRGREKISIWVKSNSELIVILCNTFCLKAILQWQDAMELTSRVIRNIMKYIDFFF